MKSNSKKHIISIGYGVDVTITNNKRAEFQIAEPPRTCTVAPGCLWFLPAMPTLHFPFASVFQLHLTCHFRPDSYHHLQAALSDCSPGGCLSHLSGGADVAMGVERAWCCLCRSRLESWAHHLPAYGLGLF